MTLDRSTNVRRNVGASGSRSNRIAWSVLLLAAAIILVRTFAFIAPILLSFILTLLLTLALNPLVLWLRGKTGGRNMATGLIVLVMGFIVVSTIWAIVGPMKSSIGDLVDSLPDYWERLQKPLILLEQQAVLSEEKLQAQVNSERKESLPRESTSKNSEMADVGNSNEPPSGDSKGSPGALRKNIAEMLRGIVGSFTAMAFNGTQVVVVLITVFFSVIFTLMDPKPIFRSIFSIVPEAYHTQALRIIYRISKFAPAWAGSMLAGMVTIGTLVFVMMWPIFGIADALVLGLIAGVFEAIPFLGPVLSTVPALLLALGQGGTTPIWVLVAFGSIQAIENNVLLPMIMAKGMKIHAFAMIFSMLLCVTCFGALGVIIAAPMVMIISIVHEELYRKRLLPTTTDHDLDRLAELVLGESRRHSNGRLNFFQKQL